jgi:Zn-dependent protease with chaperone function
MHTTHSDRARLARKVAATAATVGLSLLLPLAAFAGGINTGIEFGTGTGLSTRDVREVVARIINVAMGLLGIVAVVIILAGGFMWMTAAGNEEKVEKAKKLIFSGIIGLAIILTSFAIAQFVIRSLVQAATE